MARYIDADALIAKYENAMADNWNKKTAPSSWADAYECVIADIDDAPAADVVPKSEVEELQSELSYFKKANERQSLIIGQMDLTHKQFLKELDEIFKEHKEGFCCDWYLYEKYAELKKEYKEKEENGFNDERPNRRNV